VTGATAASAHNAGRALASLASRHADNRAAIAKRFCALLTTIKLEERAVRALAAVASICTENAANQVQR